MKSTGYGEAEAAIYDEKRFGTPHGHLIHLTEWRHVAAATDGLSLDASILEVGCGTGRLAVELGRKGFDPVGLDLSPHQLRQFAAKQGGSYVPKPILGDSTQLPFPGGTFDLVYSVRLLNQLPGTEVVVATIGEIARVLKPGGRLLIEFVNEHPGIRKRENVGGHKLTPQTAKAIVAATGCEVISCRGAFFFGANAVRALPLPVARIFSRVDQGICLLLAERGTREYLFARKPVGR